MVEPPARNGSSKKGKGMMNGKLPAGATCTTTTTTPSNKPSSLRSNEGSRYDNTTMALPASNMTSMYGRREGEEEEGPFHGVASPITQASVATALCYDQHDEDEEGSSSKSSITTRTMGKLEEQQQYHGDPASVDAKDEEEKEVSSSSNSSTTSTTTTTTTHMSEMKQDVKVGVESMSEHYGGEEEKIVSGSTGPSMTHQSLLAWGREDYETMIAFMMANLTLTTTTSDEAQEGAPTTIMDDAIVASMMGQQQEEEDLTIVLTAMGQEGEDKVKKEEDEKEEKEEEEKEGNAIGCWGRFSRWCKSTRVGKAICIVVNGIRSCFGYLFHTGL